MRYLSQRDPRWALDRIGSSPLLVGRYGCTLTCVSMLSDWFGCYLSPTAIAHNAALFTKDGLVIWSALRLRSMKFDRRAYSRDDAEIRAALRDPDRAVIFQVDGFHWVVGIKPTLLGNDYVVVDPWDGRKKSLRSAYSRITGAAYFSRK